MIIVVGAGLYTTEDRVSNVMSTVMAQLRDGLALEVQTSLES